MAGFLRFNAEIIGRECLCTVYKLKTARGKIMQVENCSQNNDKWNIASTTSCKWKCPDTFYKSKLYNFKSAQVKNCTWNDDDEQM